MSRTGFPGTPPFTLLQEGKQVLLALLMSESADAPRNGHYLVTLLPEHCGRRTHLPVVQAQGFIQVGHHMDCQQVPQQRLSLQMLEGQCRLLSC